MSLNTFISVIKNNWHQAVRMYIKVGWNIQMVYHKYQYTRNNINIDNLKILYEDNNVLIVSKSHNLLIDWSGPFYFLTLCNQIYYNKYWKADYNVLFRFRLCHRLDYPTSGIICIGYNQLASSIIGKSFQYRLARKIYLALAWGHLNLNDLDNQLSNNKDFYRVSISIGNKLKTSEKECKEKIQCTTDDPDCRRSRHAATDVMVLEHGFYQNKPASKLLLIPFTGRTHQLRVHCKHFGHNIIGDRLYGDYLIEKQCKRMMLHAFRLTLPATKLYSEIKVESEDPFQSHYDDCWQSTLIFNNIEDIK